MKDEQRDAEALKLLLAFYKIKDAGLRRSILAMAEKGARGAVDVTKDAWRKINGSVRSI